MSPRKSATRDATCRKALALGTLAVVVIYLLLNTLYLYVLPVGELAAVRGSVLDVIADRLLGSRAGDIMGVVSIVSLLASISADGLRRAARLLRDGARRHVLPGGGARASAPTARRPRRSSRRRCGARVLVLTGSANALTTYTGFSIILFNGVAVAALFVLRAPRAERAAALLDLGLSGGAGHLRGGQRASSSPTRCGPTWAGRSRRARPMGPSAAGLLIIALGLPLYCWFTRTSAPR